MTPNEKRTLTKEQEKALEDASASVARAFDAARKSLTDAGLAFGPDGIDDGDFTCRLCDCDEYVLDPRRGLKCKTCSHGPLAHKIF